MKSYDQLFFEEINRQQIPKELHDNIIYLKALNKWLEHHKKGEMLFRIDDNGEKFYITTQGTVGVLKPKQITKSINLSVYFSF